MPIYVYYCKKCKKRCEKIEKFEAPTEQPCECKNRKKCTGMMKRTFDQSGTSFKLSGGGWSKDGYHKYSIGEIVEETCKTQPKEE